MTPPSTPQESSTWQRVDGETVRNFSYDAATDTTTAQFRRAHNDAPVTDAYDANGTRTRVLVRLNLTRSEQITNPKGVTRTIEYDADGEVVGRERTQGEAPVAPTPPAPVAADTASIAYTDTDPNAALVDYVTDPGAGTTVGVTERTDGGTETRQWNADNSFTKTVSYDNDKQIVVSVDEQGARNRKVYKDGELVREVASTVTPGQAPTAPTPEQLAQTASTVYVTGNGERAVQDVLVDTSTTDARITEAGVDVRRTVAETGTGLTVRDDGRATTYREVAADGQTTVRRIVNDTDEVEKQRTFQGAVPTPIALPAYVQNDPNPVITTAATPAGQALTTTTWSDGTTLAESTMASGDAIIQTSLPTGVETTQRRDVNGDVVTLQTPGAGPTELSTRDTDGAGVQQVLPTALADLPIAAVEVGTTTEAFTDVEVTTRPNGTEVASFDWGDNAVTLRTKPNGTTGWNQEASGETLESLTPEPVAGAADDEDDDEDEVDWDRWNVERRVDPAGELVRRSETRVGDGGDSRADGLFVATAGGGTESSWESEDPDGRQLSSLDIGADGSIRQISELDPEFGPDFRSDYRADAEGNVRSDQRWDETDIGNGVTTFQTRQLVDGDGYVRYGRRSNDQDPMRIVYTDAEGRFVDGRPTLTDEQKKAAERNGYVIAGAAAVDRGEDWRTGDKSLIMLPDYAIMEIGDGQAKPPAAAYAEGTGQNDPTGTTQNGDGDGDDERAEGIFPDRPSSGAAGTVGRWAGSRIAQGFGADGLAASTVGNATAGTIGLIAGEEDALRIAGGAIADEAVTSLAADALSTGLAPGATAVGNVVGALVSGREVDITNDIIAPVGREVITNTVSDAAGSALGGAAGYAGAGALRLAGKLVFGGEVTTTQVVDEAIASGAGAACSAVGTPALGMACYGLGKLITGLIGGNSKPDDLAEEFADAYDDNQDLTDNPVSNIVDAARSGDRADERLWQFQDDVNLAGGMQFNPDQAGTLTRQAILATTDVNTTTGQESQRREDFGNLAGELAADTPELKPFARYLEASAEHKDRSAGRGDAWHQRQFNQAASRLDLTDEFGVTPTNAGNLSAAQARAIIDESGARLGYDVYNPLSGGDVDPTELRGFDSITTDRAAAATAATAAENGDGPDTATPTTPTAPTRYSGSWWKDFYAAQNTLADKDITDVVDNKFGTWTPDEIDNLSDDEIYNTFLRATYTGLDDIEDDPGKQIAETRQQSTQNIINQIRQHGVDDPTVAGALIGDGLAGMASPAYEAPRKAPLLQPEGDPEFDVADGVANLFTSTVDAVESLTPVGDPPRAAAPDAAATPNGPTQDGPVTELFGSLPPSVANPVRPTAPAGAYEGGDLRFVALTPGQLTQTLRDVSLPLGSVDPSATVAQAGAPQASDGSKLTDKPGGAPAVSTADSDPTAGIDPVAAPLRFVPGVDPAQVLQQVRTRNLDVDQVPSGSATGSVSDLLAGITLVTASDPTAGIDPVVAPLRFVPGVDPEQALQQVTTGDLVLDQVPLGSATGSVSDLLAGITPMTASDPTAGIDPVAAPALRFTPATNLGQLTEQITAGNTVLDQVPLETAIGNSTDPATGGSTDPLAGITPVTASDPTAGIVPVVAPLRLSGVDRGRAVVLEGGSGVDLFGTPGMDRIVVSDPAGRSGTAGGAGGDVQLDVSTGDSVEYAATTLDELMQAVGEDGLQLSALDRRGSGPVEEAYSLTGMSENLAGFDALSDTGDARQFAPLMQPELLAPTTAGWTNPGLTREIDRIAAGSSVESLSEAPNANGEDVSDSEDSLTALLGGGPGAGPDDPTGGPGRLAQVGVAPAEMTDPGIVTGRESLPAGALAMTGSQSGPTSASPSGQPLSPSERDLLEQISRAGGEQERALQGGDTAAAAEQGERLDGLWKAYDDTTVPAGQRARATGYDLGRAAELRDLLRNARRGERHDLSLDYSVAEITQYFAQIDDSMRDGVTFAMTTEQRLAIEDPTYLRAARKRQQTNRGLAAAGVASAIVGTAVGGYLNNELTQGLLNDLQRSGDVAAESRADYGRALTARLAEEQRGLGQVLAEEGRDNETVRFNTGQTLGQQRFQNEQDLAQQQFTFSTDRSLLRADESASLGENQQALTETQNTNEVTTGSYQGPDFVDQVRLGNDVVPTFVRGLDGDFENRLLTVEEAADEMYRTNNPATSRYRSRSDLIDAIRNERQRVGVPEPIRIEAPNLDVVPDRIDFGASPQPSAPAAAPRPSSSRGDQEQSQVPDRPVIERVATGETSPGGDGSAIPLSAVPLVVGTFFAGRGRSQGQSQGQGAEPDEPGTLVNDLVSLDYLRQDAITRGDATAATEYARQITEVQGQLDVVRPLRTDPATLGVPVRWDMVDEARRKLAAASGRGTVVNLRELSAEETGTLAVEIADAQGRQVETVLCDGGIANCQHNLPPYVTRREENVMPRLGLYSVASGLGSVLISLHAGTVGRQQALDRYTEGQRTAEVLSEAGWAQSRELAALGQAVNVGEFERSQELADSNFATAQRTAQENSTRTQQTARTNLAITEEQNNAAQERNIGNQTASFETSNADRLTTRLRNTDAAGSVVTVTLPDGAKLPVPYVDNTSNDPVPRTVEQARTMLERNTDIQQLQQFRDPATGRIEVPDSVAREALEVMQEKWRTIYGLTGNPDANPDAPRSAPSTSPAPRTDGQPQSSNPVRDPGVDLGSQVARAPQPDTGRAGGLSPSPGVPDPYADATGTIYAPTPDPEEEERQRQRDQPPSPEPIDPPISVLIFPTDAPKIPEESSPRDPEEYQQLPPFPDGSENGRQDGESLLDYMQRSGLLSIDTDEQPGSTRTNPRTGRPETLVQSYPLQGDGSRNVQQGEVLVFADDDGNRTALVNPASTLGPDGKTEAVSMPTFTGGVVVANNPAASQVAQEVALPSGVSSTPSGSEPVIIRRGATTQQLSGIPGGSAGSVTRSATQDPTVERVIVAPSELSFGYYGDGAVRSAMVPEGFEGAFRNGQREFWVPAGTRLVPVRMETAATPAPPPPTPVWTEEAGTPSPALFDSRLDHRKGPTAGDERSSSERAPVGSPARRAVISDMEAQQQAEPTSEEAAESVPAPSFEVPGWVGPAAAGVGEVIRTIVNPGRLLEPGR